MSTDNPTASQGGNTKTCLLIIDMQNDFCLPSGSLFVRGRTGDAAIGDANRLARFIRSNVMGIDMIAMTLDTHVPMQIFHPCFWANGMKHPDPFTVITADDVRGGRWFVNRDYSDRSGTFKDREELELYCLHYVSTLGKIEIWPYHCIAGSSGCSVVHAVWKAVFYHSMERNRNPLIWEKGYVPYTEYYSVFEPEVNVRHDGRPLLDPEPGRYLYDILDKFDRIIVAGEANSHCVRRSIESLVGQWKTPQKLGRIYVLEDCMSPVVVPGGTDFTGSAEEAFGKFAEAGVHLVKSTGGMAGWPEPPATVP